MSDELKHSDCFTKFHLNCNQLLSDEVFKILKQCNSHVMNKTARKYGNLSKYFLYNAILNMKAFEMSQSRLSDAKWSSCDVLIIYKCLFIKSVAISQNHAYWPGQWL